MDSLIVTHNGTEITDWRQCQVDAVERIGGVYEIVCVNGLLILGESPLKHDGKSIECSLPISDGHGPLFGDIL